MPHLVQLLDTNGDGTGITDAVGTYAGAADEFYIEAPAGVTLEIHRLIVTVRDTGAFDAEQYGNAAALTNGITLEHRDSDDNTVATFTPDPILTNTDWGTYCFDVDVKTWGIGDEVMLARLTFTKFGSAVTLTPGERLVVTVNDDLDDLVSHRFVVEGQTGDYI
jgi:hypothetical protein